MSYRIYKLELFLAKILGQLKPSCSCLLSQLSVDRKVSDREAESHKWVIFLALTEAPLYRKVLEDTTKGHRVLQSLG